MHAAVWYCLLHQVSGKTWKAAGVKAGSDKAAILGTSWEKKMADKRARQLFNEQKNAAVAAAKDKRKVSHGACCVPRYGSYHTDSSPLHTERCCCCRMYAYGCML
jgi:hypothetical protein